MKGVLSFLLCILLGFTRISLAQNRHVMITWEPERIPENIVEECATVFLRSVWVIESNIREAQASNILY